MKETNYTVRPGRRDDAAAAARLWVMSAEEHTLYDSVYNTAPDAEKVMRRFLADLSSSSHSCLFVAESGGEVVGFLSGELREGSPAFNPKTWAAVEDVYVTPSGPEIKAPTVSLCRSPPTTPGPANSTKSSASERSPCTK